MFKRKRAPVEWIKNPDPLVVQPATIQIAKQAAHPNSAQLLIDFLLSEQVAELLAKEQPLPGRNDVTGLDPAFREINAERIRSTIKNIWMNSEITLESEKQTCLMEN